jgi:ABC-2 type transport system permease protein
MTIWRLEWLRVVRTRRLLVLMGVYVFFGLTGPITARYLSAILGRLGTEGVQIQFPDPVPADGITQFAGNAAQIGLLVVVLVAAAALAFDARREMAVFLRTRTATVRDIVLPAYAVNAGVAILGFVAGSLAAWYETVVLLGALDPTAVGLGMGYGALFLAFAVALTALVAGLVRSVLATAGVTLVALLGTALVGSLTPLGRWLPTHLVGALDGLVRGVESTDYLAAAATTVVLTVAALAGAIARLARREL